jgi:RNA processing factor Prp31
MNPFFVVNISFVPESWVKRLSAVSSLLDIKEHFAYCTFRLQFEEASFTFPEIHDSLFDKHYQFAEIIGNLIHDNWNWDKELDRLKEKGMHNTHNNVSRILSMVEEIRRRLDNSQS